MGKPNQLRGTNFGEAPLVLVVVMMMFIITVTQLENERSRVHATEVPATGQSPSRHYRVLHKVEL
jgi:hypothetical protein